MASQPTILIICGSYCPCSLYSSLNTHLQSLGFDTYCKINPSCIDSPAPPTLPTVPAVSLTEDAEAVRESIRKLCGQQGRDVVLLAHSYGGMVATECLKGIGGGSVDGKGRVLGLVCVAAMLPMKGESVAGVCAEKALDFPFIGFEVSLALSSPRVIAWLGAIIHAVLLTLGFREIGCGRKSLLGQGRRSTMMYHWRKGTGS